MKTILITGGTQGLGRELVRKLNGDDVQIIVIARRQEYFDEFAKELENVEFYAVDIGDVQQITNLTKQLASRQIDVLINDAGIWTTDEIETQQPEHREQTIKTNLLGAINVTDAFLDNIVKTNSPQIIFVNSVAATQGFGGEGIDWPTYNASKWGLKGYVMALKDRFRDQNLKIGSIYPGGFESNIYENARDGEPAEYHNQSWMMTTETIANAVMFMLNQPDDANIDELVITKHGGGEL